MRCEQVRPLIDAYVEGKSAPAEAARVAAHLEGCETCRREEWDLRALLHDAAELPLSIQPARDLWTGIEDRLGEQERSKTEAARFARSTGRGPAAVPRAWLAAAAAVVIVAALGILWRTAGPGESQDPPATTTAVPTAVAPAADPVAVAAVPVGMADAEVAFRQAKGEIRALVNDLSKNLSPRTVREINENLKLIDDAVREIQEALAKDPGNRELKRMLVATQQREVAMLQRVAQRTTLH